MNGLHGVAWSDVGLRRDRASDAVTRARKVKGKPRNVPPREESHRGATTVKKIEWASHTEERVGEPTFGVPQEQKHQPARAEGRLTAHLAELESIKEELAERKPSKCVTCPGTLMNRTSSNPQV